MTNKIKIDCPINFLDKKELEMLIANNDFVISSDPECLIVNPGCDFYYDKKYFKNFKNLKVVGSPSTGINHLDLKYLKYFVLLRILDWRPLPPYKELIG